MITLPPAVRIHFATQPVDMRLSFRGLTGLVRSLLQADPLSGHLFCFTNRSRDRLKILFFDRSGFCIFYKRLSRGSFQLPQPQEGQAHVSIDAGQLALILEGIDLRSVKYRLRYRPENLTSSTV